MATTPSTVQRQHVLPFSPGARIPCGELLPIAIATVETPVAGQAPVERQGAFPQSPLSQPPAMPTQQTLGMPDQMSSHESLQKDVNALQGLVSQLTSEIGILKSQASDNRNFVVAELDAMNKYVGTSQGDYFDKCKNFCLRAIESNNDALSGLSSHTEDRLKSMQQALNDARVQAARVEEAQHAIPSLRNRLGYLEAEREQKVSDIAGLRSSLEELRSEVAGNHSVALVEIGAQTGSFNDVLASMERKLDELKHGSSGTSTAPSAKARSGNTSCSASVGGETHALINESMDFSDSRSAMNVDTPTLMEAIRENKCHISQHSSLLMVLQAGLAILEERFAAQDLSRVEALAGQEETAGSASFPSVEGEDICSKFELLIKGHTEQQVAVHCDLLKEHKAELQSELLSWEERLQAQTNAAISAMQQSYAKLTGDLMESKDHQLSSLAEVRSGLASELSEARTRQAAELLEAQTGLQAELAALQLTVESHSRLQETMHTEAIEATSKLAVDISHSDDRMVEQASLIAELQAQLAGLTEEIAEQGSSQSESFAKSGMRMSEHEIQLTEMNAKVRECHARLDGINTRETEQNTRLGQQHARLDGLCADLVSLRESTDASSRENVVAIKLRTEIADAQAAQLQQCRVDLCDAVLAATNRADALSDELAQERQQRIADCSGLGGRLQEGLASLEAKQAVELKTGLASCAAEFGECRQLIDDLRAEQDDKHRTSSETHALSLAELSSKLDKGRDHHNDAIATLEDSHSMQLKQRSDEIQLAMASCRSLEEQLVTERQTWRLEQAKLSAELKVQLNCVEKQSAKMLLTEIQSVQLDAADSNSKLASKLESLREDLTQTSKEEEDRHQRALEGQRALAARADEALADGLAALEGKLEAQESDFNGKIALAMGQISERGDRWSEQLRAKTEALQEAWSDGMAEVAGRLDTHQTQMDHQQSALSERLAAAITKLDDHRRDVLSQLEKQAANLETKIGQESSSLAAAIDESSKCVLQQLTNERDILSESIEQSAAKLRQLDSKLMEVRELDSQLVRSHAHLSSELHTSIKSAEEKTDAQLRLLAEDADQRALVFVQDLEAERQERDARECGLQEELGRMKTELVGLRALIHDRAFEDLKR